MANDKSKHEDNPPGSPSLLQWFEEIEKNEAAMFRRPVNSSNAVGADDITMPDPLVPLFLFPGTEGTSNPYAKQMPLTDLNLMNDLTPFSNSQNPVPDDGSVYGKGLIPTLPITDSDFLCCEGNTDFGYSMTPHSVVNASSKVCEFQKPYVDRELVSATGSAAALNSIQQDGELYSNTSRPQLIDNFTGDGGSTPMSWSTLDDVEIVINNNLLISGGQEDHPERLDGSCLTLGIGCQSNDLSGRNVGYDSERAVLPQSNIFHSQNANRCLHFPDVAAGFSCVQNNMGQVEKQQQFLVPGNMNVYLGVEGNCDERSLYFDPNNGIQGYPAVPILPVGNSLARLPDSGLSKVNELPLSSCLNTSTCLPLSDQSQKHHMESGTRNTYLHNQSGKPFTANEGIAAQVAERGLFPEEFRFSQLASNPYRPEVVNAVLSSTDHPGSVITGQELPTTKVNRAFVGTSVKRGAAEVSACSSQAQPTFSGEEIPATKVSKTSRCLRAFVGTSVKRGAAETFTGTSHADPSKARRTQSSTGLSAEAPFLEVSSLQILSQDASFSSRDHTSPSLLHQAKSTPLNQPQSQTRSALPPEVKGLPSLTRNASSLQLQAKSAPSLPPFPQTASSLTLKVRSIPSLSSLSQTSPSLPLQAKSTPLLPFLFQTTSSLAPQVKGISSLPSLSQTAPSIQTQAKSIPSLPPTTSSIPTKTRRNVLLQHQSQTAHSLLPQAKTTTSLPLPYLTVPSVLPITNTTSPPTLSQNGPSCPPHPQNASPLPSQKTTGRPLPPKSLRGSSLPQKPRTALPPSSHIPSSLSSKFSAPPPIPPQPQTASPVPGKYIAPPFSPQTTPPVTQKVNAPPLPPQHQTDPVLHIKWNAADETQLIGHKCFICKRDLAFTPEGPVSVPPIAPIVAVLPCGHTFHDHCLQLITPEDENKSPPCIPCAIGES
ncbi:proline-rich protein 36 [Rosa sericea]